MRPVPMRPMRPGIPQCSRLTRTAQANARVQADAFYLEPGRALPVCWRISAQERKKHPELPAEAAVAGRLLVVAPRGLRPLYLFTTLEGGAEELAALYARRWEMELDLRALKRSMHLHHVYGKSQAAVEKQILTAVIGYALVRACMAAAARHAGLPPRRLSFTGCCSLLNRMLDRLYTGSRPRGGLPSAAGTHGTVQADQPRQTQGLSPRRLGPRGCLPQAAREALIPVT